MTSSFAHSAARGVYFTLIAQAVKIVLQLSSVVVLSRLLTPHDYGLIAIVLIVVGFGEIFRDFGLTSASIQAPELSRGQRDNLFWINAAIGVGLAAATFLVSWPAAWVTGQPEIIAIMHWLCLLFVLNGLATQYRASLMRALRFRALAIVDIASAAIALAVAVGCALAGASYWSLVVQQLTSGVVVLVGVIAAARWLPRRPSRAASVRDMVTFGWNLVATNLLVYVGSQIDTALVTLRFGTTPLGLYNRAYQIVMTPLGQARSPLRGVAVPVLSRVQADPARFNLYVSSAQLALGYGFGLPLAAVAGVAAPLVSVALGPQWTSATDIVRLFAAAGVLTTLAYVGYWVYVSRGLGKQLFRYTIVSTSIKIVSIVIGSSFGLVGVAVGFAVAPAIAWPLSLWWLSRVTTIPVRALYLGALRVLVACGVTSAAAWATSVAFTAYAPVVALLAGVVAGTLAAAALLVAPRVRADLAQILAFVRLMRARRA